MTHAPTDLLIHSLSVLDTKVSSLARNCKDKYTWVPMTIIPGFQNDNYTWVPMTIIPGFQWQYPARDPPKQAAVPRSLKKSSYIIYHNHHI